MLRSLTKLQSEVGNALIEFVFVFCVGLAGMLALALNVETSIRSHFAALSIANETLRTWQVTESKLSASEIANSVALTFSLDPTLVSINFEGKCSVRVRVRDAIEVANAEC